MRIFLIGFMGCGKTTIGKQLANKLGMKFIDMDDFIVEQQGMSINKIFETKGEDAFRQIEKETLQELFKLDKVVIGAGGGTPCFFDNMEQMNRHAETFYLKMDTEGLVQRLKDQKDERPLIKDKSTAELHEFIQGTLEKREPFYSKAKHVIQAQNTRVDDFMPYFDNH